MLHSWHIYDYIKGILLFQREVLPQRALLKNPERFLLIESLSEISFVKIHIGVV